MATKLTSSEVSAGDTVSATERNALRDDIIALAGDYATAGGSANAFTLSIAAEYTAYATGDIVKFKANHSITGSATLNINSIGAKTIKRSGFTLSQNDIETNDIVIVIYDGADFLIIGISKFLPQTIIPFIFGNTTVMPTANASRWAQMFNNNTYCLIRDTANADELNLLERPTQRSAYLGQDMTDRSSLAINVNIGCAVLDSTTEYLLCADDGGATVKRYDNDGQNETAVSFSGTAPTAIRRMGYDPDNGYVWIMDGTGKDATQIRRYTFSGSTLTNINSDITLSAAPAAAGSGNMYIGHNYMVLTDDVSTPCNFVRYNKSNGTKIDDIAFTTGAGAGEFFAGLCISSPIENQLYLIIVASSGAPGFAYLALYDIG